MIKKSMLLMATFFVLSSATAQIDVKSKIGTALKDYFASGRENIHLHLNKDLFMTNENIWLKGYVIEKKSALPHSATANVHVNLLDSEGKIIRSHLIYSENSLFEGHIILDNSLPSGRYYVQSFTNFMNNFTEDESAIYPIKIVNVNDEKYADYNSINWRDLQISLRPETGTFLEGVTNTIGIKITDCKGHGIEVSAGKVEDPNGLQVSNFATNSQGYGRFDIIDAKNGKYKVSFEKNGIVFTEELPHPTLTGISFNVNNYGLADKALISIRTNDRTLSSIPGQPYIFAINQNDVVSFAEFELDPANKEQTIAIPAQYISHGVNTVRLFDSKMNQLGERLIFKPFSTPTGAAVKIQRQRTDSIVFRGNSPLRLASLSISVLPENTVSKSDNTIYDSFYFKSYADSGVKNTQYYFENLNRKKHYELDNVFLHLKSKYPWNAIMAGPPQIKSQFDSGITIKGTINSPVADRDKVTIQMSSPLLGLHETTTLNSKNEFIFENVMAVDSSTIYFSLIDAKQRYAKLNMYTRLISPPGRFLKTFKPNAVTCADSELITLNADWPPLQDAINLDDVNVDAIDKSKEMDLKYMRMHNNNMARGYKITDLEADSFRDILSWLASHGYNVSQEGGNVVLVRNYSGSFSGSNSPAVFIDDALVPEVSFLLNMNLRDIDEIYINRRGFGAGSIGANGIIRIYTKKGYGSTKSAIKVNSQSLVVENGYQQYKPYVNPPYSNVQHPSFSKFGTIGWISNVATDENGMFHFSIPNLYQDKVILVIEGINGDGEVYSDRLAVDIPNR